MPDLYQSVGGIEGCRKLSNAFYTRVVRDPVLKPLFPSIHCAVEALATYLAQFLGGPCLYSQRRWHLSLFESHVRFRIGPKERHAWLRNMQAAMIEVALPEGARSALTELFEQAATYLTEGDASPVQGATAEPWKRQLALDEAVAWVRVGRVPEFECLQQCFEHDPMARVGLLALMIGVGMIEPVRRQLTTDPDLARGRYYGGRTLLHAAVIAGNVELVELLLRLGADPAGGEGHSPLYELANSGSAFTCADIVPLLIAAGVDVNKPEGVTRCTALHMAARRDNVAVARALLAAGADPHARDRRGDTPLQRAINCRKKDVAALLQQASSKIPTRPSPAPQTRPYRRAARKPTTA